MHRVDFLIQPGFETLCLGGLTAFALANELAAEVRYEVRVIAEVAGPVRLTAGVELFAGPMRDGAIDTLMIGAGFSPARASPETVGFVKRAARAGGRLSAVCAGAFILAEAGLLAGRRATVHWSMVDELQARFPEARVEPDALFTEDRGIWTCAGMSAVLDMTLAMIERDNGRGFAKRLAKALLMDQRRPAHRSQRSALLDLEPRPGRMEAVLAYIRGNLASPLGLHVLADVAHLSPRHFERMFKRETGQSPARAVESLRLEAARAMVARGEYALSDIALQTGFASRDWLRDAYRRAFGRAPSEDRLNGTER